MRKLLLSTVAAGLLTTAGFAANIATDGTGQYLMGAKYFAQDGFETKVRLVNTSTYKSVVMRFVVREFVSSNEVDVIVDLSPTDVWEARIYRDADGKSYLYSTDDSNYRVTQSPISQGKGIGLSSENETDSTRKARTFRKGYVEVYPMFAFAHGAINENGTFPIAPKINKEKVGDNDFSLYDFVDAVTGGPAAVQGQYCGNTNGSYSCKNVDYARGIELVGNDDVYGEVQIINTKQSPNFSTALPMIAIEDLNGSQTQALIEDRSIMTSMAPGKNTETNDYLGVNDINSIYDALEISTVTIPYENFGKNSDIKFSWWMDMRGGNLDEPTDEYSTTCRQIRQFSTLTRDMEETRVVVNPTADFVSPEPTEAEVTRPWTRCESGFVGVNDIVSKAGNYESGMVKLYDFDDATLRETALNGKVDNLAAFVSYQRAVKNADNAYNVIWTIPAVERNPK